MKLLIAFAVAAGAMIALPSTSAAQTPPTSRDETNDIAAPARNPNVKAIVEAKKDGVCGKMTNSTVRWCFDRGERAKDP